MKTKNNIIFEFDNDSNIYIRKNITGIDGNCLVPFMPVRITVHRENPYFRSAGNCLVEVAAKTLLFAGNEFEIPDDGSVRVIGIHAFAGRMDFGSCGDMVEIPHTVRHIYPEAFYMASIKQVALQEGLISIGTRAFACSTLRGIHIPRTVKRIAYDAFFKCNLRRISSDSPHYIVKNGCLIEKSTMTLIAVLSRQKVCIPDGVKLIASGVFWGEVRHRAVFIPASVHKIQGHNFYGCYRRVYSPCDKTDFIDEDVPLFVGRNTYAEYFAKKHHLPYFYSDS